MNEQWVKLDEEVAKLTSEINIQQRIKRQLPEARRYVDTLENKLAKAKRELPEQREIPSLLSSVSDLAKDAGLEVQLFKPSPENYREFYAEVPVSVVVNGTYHEVASFFDEVGRLSRIVTISDISFKEPKLSKEHGAKLQALCTATTFRFLDEKEKIARAESEDSQGRRRK
jgi:type IV pilus assembly protein PilO